MNPTALEPILEILWIWVAGPLALVASIVLTIRLGVPQLRKIGEAFRALRAEDERAEGDVHPATATILSATATYGAAGAVGAATAVSLGGAGAVAWVWLFSFVFMPLRMGEAALARTAPPGRAGEVTGSLAGRLLDDPVGGLRGAGWALLVLVPLAAFAFYGGTHGEAVMGAAEQLAPDSALPITLIVAGLGLVLALLPARRVGALAGWIAVVAFLALLAAGLVAFLSDPGRGFGGFGRAVMDAIYGAPQAGAFSGALAGEIAMAAMLHALPPLAGSAGVGGAWHAEAKSETTRGQASAALLGPLLYGVLTTLVGLSFVATNAFADPVEGQRTVRETTFYTVGFDTVSQRQEETRRLDGILRPQDGETGVVEVHAGTERGMVLAPRFEDRGQPANVAIRVVGGEAIEVQRPGHLGALERAPDSALDEVTVHGRMLPRGATLVSASMAEGSSPVLARVALAALLLLGALGVMAWGTSTATTLRARVPDKAARAAGAIPAIGLALAALGVIPSFATLGVAVAALLSLVVSLALIVRGKDVQSLLAPRKGARPEAPSAREPEPGDEPKKKRKKRKKKKR